jgi:hypothetical protein
MHVFRGGLLYLADAKLEVVRDSCHHVFPGMAGSGDNKELDLRRLPNEPVNSVGGFQGCFVVCFVFCYLYFLYGLQPLRRGLAQPLR